MIVAADQLAMTKIWSKNASPKNLSQRNRPKLERKLHKNTMMTSRKRVVAVAAELRAVLALLHAVLALHQAAARVVVVVSAAEPHAMTTSVEYTI